MTQPPEREFQQRPAASFRDDPQLVESVELGFVPVALLVRRAFETGACRRQLVADVLPAQQAPGERVVDDVRDPMHATYSSSIRRDNRLYIGWPTVGAGPPSARWTNSVTCQAG